MVGIATAEAKTAAIETPWMAFRQDQVEAMGEGRRESGGENPSKEINPY